MKYYLSKLINRIQIPSLKSSEIHNSSKVLSKSNIINLEMGRYSYVGNNCTISNAKIGSFCSIADNCIIGGAGHPLDWISTSPVFHKGKNILKKNFSDTEYNATKQTLIGNDVWIGSNVLIKSGITINDGAVIGMGSVVTKDVGAYEVIAGNPAKLIKYRFDEDTRRKLLKIQWWDFDDKELEIISDFFSSSDDFIDEVYK